MQSCAAVAVTRPACFDTPSRVNVVAVGKLQFIVRWSIRISDRSRSRGREAFSVSLTVLTFPFCFELNRWERRILLRFRRASQPELPASLAFAPFGAFDSIRIRLRSYYTLNVPQLATYSTLLSVLRTQRLVDSSTALHCITSLQLPTSSPYVIKPDRLYTPTLFYSLTTQHFRHVLLSIYTCLFTVLTNPRLPNMNSPCSSIQRFCSTDLHAEWVCAVLQVT